MPYLIDGHNVIAALPDINLEDDNDEAQLVIKLRTWSSRIRRKIIVIFDGGITGGPSYDLSSPDVTVIFAARFHTNADRIIRERLKMLRDAPNWTVISSDLEVLDQARLAGAKVMTAQYFADLLNQPLPEPEKPKYVSPAAVNAWLELFPEPQTTEEPPRPQLIQTPPSQPEQRTRHTSQRIPKSKRRPTREREMRSIGEQLGHEIASEPESVIDKRLSDKPADISPEEVDAWLHVFHDPPETTIVKPKPVQKHVGSKRPKLPVVRKQGDLTNEEVSEWLDIFPEPADTPEQTLKSSSSPPKRKYKQRKLDRKLAQHKSKLVNPDDENPLSLSEEDLELWHRMFGSEQ